jgi:hypothetical protein
MRIAPFFGVEFSGAGELYARAETEKRDRFRQFPATIDLH